MDSKLPQLSEEQRQAFRGVVDGQSWAEFENLVQDRKAPVPVTKIIRAAAWLTLAAAGEAFSANDRKKMDTESISLLSEMART